MRKTFDQLLPGDKIYRVVGNEMSYKEYEVKRVEPERLYFDHNDFVPRYKSLHAEIKEKQSGWSSNLYKHIFYFADEPSAIRFCKARVMKNIFHKIEVAKNAIQSVKDFRLENYDLLNHSWTEDQILKLERELG